MIVLEIIGGTVLVVLTVIALIYIFFRLKYGKYLDLDPSNLEPLTVHLNEDIAPDWLDQTKAKALVSELEASGYEKGKPYSIYEMDGCLLLHLSQGHYSAVVYSHPMAGIWIDILVEDVRGNQFTFTNAPMGDGIESRPDSEKKYSPEATAGELHGLARVLVEDESNQFKNLSVVDFRKYFEESYKKDMAWKNRKGGLSFEEFQNVERQAPFKSKKKNIDEAFMQVKLDELDQWHEAALEEYCKENNIAEEEWSELEYKLFIVPFRTHAGAFLDYLEAQEYLQESEVSKLLDAQSIDSDIPGLFQGINGRLSPELRASFVAEASFPLQLSIYRLSEKMSN